jgi:hypothetical protein
MSKARKARSSNPNATQKVKGAYNVYTIGDTSTKSWTPEEIDPADPNVNYPKYYLVKNKDNWDFDFKVKGLNKSIKEKGYLYRLMQFMGINNDDLCMVSERNVKHLPKSCKEFVKYANDNIDLTYGKGVSDPIYYRKYNFDQIKNHKNFSLLNKNNCFVIFVNTIMENIQKYEQFIQINPLIDADLHDSKLMTTIQTKNKAYQHIANKIGVHSWDTDTIMDIVLTLDAVNIR